MIYIYFSAMVIAYLISHIGINNKYRSTFISVLSAGSIFVILVLISGFRSQASIGDTPFYAHSYKLIGQNPVFDSKTKDVGFVIIMILLNKITSDPQILIFLTAFVTNLFIILALYRYSKPFELGILLYFGTVLFYVTMNGMRQSMVAAILLWAVKYVINNSWKRYFLLVLLLSMLHQSALIFLPLYFLVRKKAWGKGFWITIGASVVVMGVFKPMLGTIAGILESTSYGNYGKDMLTNTSSTNIIRLFITIVPIVLAYFVRDRLKEEWPGSNVFIFLSLFNFIFMLLSTQYLFFYRLCIYFDLYNLILIPHLLPLFKRQKRLSLYVFTIVFYFIFSFYQVSLWGDNYRNILVSYIK